MADDAVVAANLMERIGRLARTEEHIDGLYPAQWAALRYLSRANRFSRTPKALTKYLATTRGTMSQTIIALERKGYVERLANETDKRSVNVELTDNGRDKLQTDPLTGLADTLRDALGKNVGTLREMLEQTLGEIIRANDGKAFGQCKSCRHFNRTGGATKSAPYRCRLLEVDLSEVDSDAICIEHELA